MSWLLLGAALAQTATHDGTVVGDRIEWTSTFHGPGTLCTRVLPADRVANGTVNDGLACGREPLEVVRTQPLGDLHPPFGSDGVHRITLRGTAFTPDPSTGLVKTASGWSAPTVTRLDRMRFDGDLGRHGVRGLRAAVYLRDPADVALPVRYASNAVTAWARAGLGVGFGLVLLLGGLAYRALDRLARRERVDAWMADPGVRTELEQDGIV